MDVLIALACLLATYRLATDVAWETGPFAVYEWLRGWAVQRFGAHSTVAEGVACPICLSFWFGLPFGVLLALWLATPWLWPLWWLALAGGAAFLARLK